MIYVYDILLNFNKDLIEYFEWEDTDNIKYAKKITLFKIDSKTMNDFLTKDIVFEDNFVKTTLKYELDGLKDKASYTLFTDGKIVIGIIIKNNRIDLVSRLLIDEEEEVIDIAERVDFLDINYRVLNNKNNKDLLLTRKEKNIKEQLTKEINYLYSEKNSEKLEYLYYEYTGKERKDIDYIYKYLIDSLNSLNDRHNNLVDILKLANKNI